MKFILLTFGFIFLQSSLLFGQEKFSSNFLTIDTSNSLLPTNKITTIYFDNFENIWLGTYDQGLIRINQNEIKIFNKDNSALTSNYIYRIKEDKKNNLWAATMGGGIIKIKNDSITIFNQDNSALGHNWIYDFDIDEENNLWIGTWGNGLVKYDGNNFYNINDSNKTIPYKVCDVLVDDSIIWVGSVYGLISIKGKEYFQYNLENSELMKAPIYKLLKTRAGELWLGYKQSGLARFENGKWNYIDTASHISAYEMAEDNNGCLWIANFTKGLVKYDGNNFTYFSKDNSDLPDDLIYSVTVDENNNKWLGSYFGGIIIFYENEVKLKEGILKSILK
jgi:ligand-binding sensor domain-containing protein